MDKGQEEITMAKQQGHDHDIDCIIDTELWRLFYKSVRAKYKVDLDIEYVTPLLMAGHERTDGLVSRIDDSMEEVESQMEDFKLAHREYIMKILENPGGDEEEISLTIDKCNEYLKEIVEQVHDVLALHFNFKYKLQVSKLKTEV